MSVIAKILMLACALETVYSPCAGDPNKCNNCKTCIKPQCALANCNGCCPNCNGRWNGATCNCCECTTTASPIITSHVTTTASSTATASVNTSASDTTTSSVAGSHDHQVVAVVVSVVLAVVVVAGAVVVVVWWKRKRASKSGETGNSHTNWRMSDTDVPPQTNQDNEVATRSKERQNAAAGGSQNRKSEHVYTHIDSVTNHRPKSTTEGGDSSVYNEPDDTADRKLPTAPAQDRPYSLARNPSTEHGGGPQESAPLTSVYSLAHTTNHNTEKPQYFILEEEIKVSSQNKVDGGQYFILEKGAATDECDNGMVTRGQNDASVHDAHEYFPLDASDRAQNSAEGDAEYTPLHGLTGLRPKIPAKMHGEHEYSDLDPGMKMKPVGHGAEYTALKHNFNPLAHAATGTLNSTGGCMHKEVKGNEIQAFHFQPSDGQEKDGQYVILEKEGEIEDKDDAASGQYFVLKNDKATDDQKDETRGQYFVLEDDTTDRDDKDQKQNGQYFVLEKEATGDDNEAKDSQYFVLEKNAANANESQQDSPYFVPEEDATDFSNINSHVQAATGTTTGGQGRTGRNHPSATATDEEYSHLDHSGKGGKSSRKADPDKDYMHLHGTPNGDSNEEEARNAREYFEIEPGK